MAVKATLLRWVDEHPWQAMRWRMREGCSLLALGVGATVDHTLMNVGEVDLTMQLPSGGTMRLPPGGEARWRTQFGSPLPRKVSPYLRYADGAAP